MKILWMSNSPKVPTGYGVVTNHVAYALVDRYGTDNVAVLAYYGAEGKAEKSNNLIIFPKLWDKYGRDAAKLCISNWKPDVFVSFFDVWVMPKYLPRSHPRWCVYTPVDHRPIPPPVVEPCSQAYQVIAMSKFAEEEYKKVGIRAVRIEHGVDTNLFRPPKSEEAKAKAKEFLGFDREDFVIFSNFANKGDRKDCPRMTAAIQRFFDENPDARKDTKWYLHTWMRHPAGRDLQGLLDVTKLTSIHKHTPVWNMYMGLPFSMMAKIYQAADLFINLARGEGFGLPVLEALSSGVPCVVNNFSSMTELVKGHGWLIPYKTWEMSALNSLWFIADEVKAADAIAEAYNKESKRRKYGKMSRRFALNYDWKKKIIPLWYDFFDQIEMDIAESALITRLAAEAIAV